MTSPSRFEEGDVMRLWTVLFLSPKIRWVFRQGDMMKRTEVQIWTKSQQSFMTHSKRSSFVIPKSKNGKGVGIGLLEHSIRATLWASALPCHARPEKQEDEVWMAHLPSAKHPQNMSKWLTSHWLADPETNDTMCHIRPSMPEWRHMLDLPPEQTITREVEGSRREDEDYFIASKITFVEGWIPGPKMNATY